MLLKSPRRKLIFRRHKTQLALYWNLAEEAKVQIIFSPKRYGQSDAPAIAGQLTVSEAIQRILSNTQLEFVMKQNDSLYVIRDRNNSNSNNATANANANNSTETAETDRVERIQVVGSNIRGARSAGSLPGHLACSAKKDNY